MATRVPSALSALGPVDSIPVTSFDPAGNYSGNLRLMPLGYRQMALSIITPVNLSTILPGVIVAQLKMEGAGSRYCDDGVTPTPTFGQPLDIGETLTYDARVSGGNFLIIGQTAGAILNVMFYGAQGVT